MGMFKQIKDAKKMVEAAPGLIDQSMQMAGQAQQMAAAQQAAAQQQLAAQQQAMGQPAAGMGSDFEPIAGVSLELYAQVAKGLAAYNYDQSKAVEVAASKGIPAETWQLASSGWNARVTANPAVAQQFNAYWRAS